MKRRIKVRELIQREDLRGEVVELFHSRNTGMIHGDDGYDVTFSQESLVVGVSYRELSLALLMGSFSRRERRFPQQSMCILRPVCKQKQARGRKT